MRAVRGPGPRGMLAPPLRTEREDVLARRIIIALATCALACGPVAYEQQQAANPECPPTAGGDQGTADELSELLAEVLAPRICEQVTGSFIGMPGEGGSEGTAAGLDPSVGRWWIRQCQAEVVDGRLAVGIAGSGWTWLDRESMGFRVRQYLRFDAAATFSASLHVGYDARTRIATVWLRPAPGVTAQVTPLGLVRAEATGVISSVLGGFLDLTGSSASDRARAQATEEGSTQLRDKLATGFTVTYALDTNQMDFMLGELARGQVPERPWPTIGSTAWIVNERSAIWPGGMDVVGPVPADEGPLTLDVVLEEGEGASLRRVCDDELARWLDAAWNGAAGPSMPGETVATLGAVGQTTSVALEPRACRSLLLVTPNAQASLPVMLRYRVMPVVVQPQGVQVALEPGASPQHGTSSYGTSSTVVSPSGPAAVRIEIRSASITAQTPSGGSWDVIGGDPDPFVVVTSIPQRREIDRTSAVANTREARFERRVPGALRLSDFPIRFLVYDEDVTSDELIGVADVDASAVRGAVELVLPIRSEGQTPVTTGSLRVRFTPVQ